MNENFPKLEKFKPQTAEAVPQTGQSYDTWTQIEADKKFDADKEERGALMEAARREAANRVLDQITNMEQSLLDTFDNNQLTHFKDSQIAFETLRGQL